MCLKCDAACLQWISGACTHDEEGDATSDVTEAAASAAAANAAIVAAAAASDSAAVARAEVEALHAAGHCTAPELARQPLTGAPPLFVRSLVFSFLPGLEFPSFKYCDLLQIHISRAMIES